MSWKGELGKRELNHRGGLELAGIDFKESIADFFKINFVIQILNIAIITH